MAVAVVGDAPRMSVAAVVAATAAAAMAAEDVAMVAVAAVVSASFLVAAAAAAAVAVAIGAGLTVYGPGAVILTTAISPAPYLSLVSLDRSFLYPRLF